MYIQTVNKSTVWLSPDKMFLCPFYQSRNSFCGKGQGGLGKNKYTRKTCNLQRFDISVEKGTWSLESQGATVQMVLKVSIQLYVLTYSTSVDITGSEKQFDICKQ